jgi:hypothetical protein
LDEIISIDEELEAGSSLPEVPVSPFAGHAIVGSKQSKHSFEDLDKLKKSEVGFQGFRIRLARFFNNFLPSHGIALPGGKQIKFQASDTVRKHLAVSGFMYYSSVIDC